MFLIASTNNNILSRFQGKKLVRIDKNTFFTEDFTDGFRVSSINKELKGEQLTIYTENSAYTFSENEPSTASSTSTIFMAEPKCGSVAVTPQIALYQMLMKGAC